VPDTDATDEPEERRAPYDPMPHGRAEVGVGPWQGPLPEGEQYDARLLAEGDRRNVVDRYRYWSMEAIVADLDARRHDFHVAIENWQHDFNIGTIVRTANAFLAKEVHIVGNRRWNRRGAMVTDRYQHIRHHPTPQALAEHLDDLGVALLAGGGRLVVEGDTDWKGPGHNAILSVPSGTYNVYHSYDANAAGIPTLRISEMQWSADGWPISAGP
jgi:hypothetical protein